MEQEYTRAAVLRGMGENWGAKSQRRGNSGDCLGAPNPYNLSESTGGTPPISTAVRPPFVSLCLAGFKALEKGKRRNTPPICTALRLPFVPQYASHLYRWHFWENLGVVSPHLLGEILRVVFSQF